jgi:DNA-binding response OmpR family regulator
MAGETILIVEDRRENIVHLANNVLKPRGYQILTAMDGQRGLKRILSDKPDLVILDLNMPKMDGLEVLAALQERGVETPVILTTFYGSEQVARQALRLGAVDYIVKPYEIGEMLESVERALAQRSQHPIQEAPVQPSPPAHHALSARPAEAEDAPEKAMPLTRQVERWMRDMNILTRVGKALVANLEMDRVCTRTVEAAIYVTRADHAFLYLRPDQASGLNLCAARGPQDPGARILHQPVQGGLPAQVLRSGETAIHTKAPSDVNLFEIVGHTLGPAIAAPLRWQRETIGVLMAARNPGEAAFNEADVEWLSGLSDYAATAVHNAWAYQQQVAAASTPATSEALSHVRRDLARLADDLAAAAQTARRLSDELEQES